MRLIYGAAAALGLLAGPAFAVVVEYSDKAAFDIAVASATSTSLEEFDVAYDAPKTYQAFASGLIVTADALSDSFRVQNYSGNNRLEARVDGSKGHNWFFASGVNAFGFEIFDAGHGPGSHSNDGEEITITVDDGSGPQSFVLSTLVGGQDGYVGFVGESPFLSVRFDAPEVDVFRDRYQVDNVVMHNGVVLSTGGTGGTGGGGGAVVPIGAAAPLLIGGIGAFGVFRRRAARRG